MINKFFKFLVFIVLIIIAFYLFHIKRQEKLLNESINNYIETKEVINNSKLKNEYREIEKSILDYLETSDDCLNEINDIKIKINDYEFFTAKSISNSLKDNFASDKKVLSEYEKTINEKLDEYILLNNYDNLLKEYNNDSKYFKNIYIKLLGPESKYKKEVIEYGEEKELYKKYFLTANKYVDFLKTSTVIVDQDKNLIFFRNQNEITEYDKIHYELKSIVNKI